MTHDIKKHPYWTRDEFMAFLLLYCAGIDMECTEEERQMILRQIDSAHLATVEAEYNALSDYERLSVINAYRPEYYNDPAQRAELLSVVESIFSADGTFDTMEHNVYRMLQKIL